MKKVFVAALAIAAVGAAALPAGASSTFEKHFSVIGLDVAAERVGDDGFKFKEILLAPYNLDQKVGRLKGKCTFDRESRKARCKVGIHLDGTIGGYGDLLVKGNFGRGDNTLLVINGTDGFDGVAGKITVHPRPGKFESLHFDLVR